MPSSPILPTDPFRRRFEQLRTSIDAVEIEITPRIASLDAMIREGETWIHRRAAYNERDKCCYRTGGALEPYGGHRLNDIQLSGFDALGAVGVLLLAEVAIGHPGLAVSELLGELFESAHGPTLHAWGVWSRWHWCQTLYVEETETFLASPAASDPSWRPKTVTPRQVYLIDEIARMLGEPVPTFTTRGEAFDHILAAGGNPRFTEKPPRPSLPGAF
ncbi:hypothetical protein HZF05_13715 [Sphingomonas sp. CGMCC 1.13654]|uniref:Uncharacterized protein n=1 Tax=Sphingomonas chungangi TaxID=2683589 RepID=A0A838L8R0_9SPHN|nr:hypothetical protein [Sphingomonas chungangi]MBA2935142.1 hypothetical protein [Sphingomonas chungangi]MVW57706.1 hypothetical protein [Sphingomonas chungangi]